jgi:hypothetical protein
LHDANFNALAADGPAGTDAVAFSASCDQGTLGDIPPGIAMPQVADGYPGMLFKSAPGQLDNGAIEAPGNHATYLGATDAYGFKFSYAPPDPAAEGSCTITAQVNRSYDPGAPGFEPGGSGSLQEVLTATFKP